MALEDIKHKHVLQAIREFNRLGREKFLEKHGNPARTTFLHYRGRRYDVKPIIKAAHSHALPGQGLLEGLHTNEATRRLRHLEFTVETNPDTAHFSQPQTISPEEADDDPFDPNNVEDGRERIKQTILRRRGQGEFRNALIDAYEKRCAITGCSTLAVLEAAHIFPYRGRETNHPSNGLLLRADLHTLFDCGKLAIHPVKKKVIVASSVKDEAYKDMHGRPMRNRDIPSEEALRLHLDNCSMDCQGTDI